MADKILVVDDDFDILCINARHLTRKGYEVVKANDGFEAIEIFKEQGEFTILVSDWGMPKMNGSELVQKIRSIDPTVIALLFTAQGTMGLVGTLAYGAFEFLEKPLDSMNELSAAVGRAIAHRNLLLAEEERKNPTHLSHYINIRHR